MHSQQIQNSDNLNKNIRKFCLHKNFSEQQSIKYPQNIVPFTINEQFDEDDDIHQQNIKENKQSQVRNSFRRMAQLANKQQEKQNFLSLFPKTPKQAKKFFQSQDLLRSKMQSAQVKFHYERKRSESPITPKFCQEKQTKNNNFKLHQCKTESNEDESEILHSPTFKKKFFFNCPISEKPNLKQKTQSFSLLNKKGRNIMNSNNEFLDLGLEQFQSQQQNDIKFEDLNNFNQSNDQSPISKPSFKQSRILKRNQSDYNLQLNKQYQPNYQQQQQQLKQTLLLHTFNKQQTDFPLIPSANSKINLQLKQQENYDSKKLNHKRISLPRVNTERNMDCKRDIQGDILRSQTPRIATENDQDLYQMRDLKQTINYNDNHQIIQNSELISQQQNNLVKQLKAKQVKLIQLKQLLTKDKKQQLFQNQNLRLQLK